MDSGSETDFELDEEMENAMKHEEARSDWRGNFQHLLEFSEDILPTVLYRPMKCCPVFLRESIQHVAKTEGILQRMGNDTRMLEVQLAVWNENRGPSKSRMQYSVELYKSAGDVLYFAFYQNREIRLDTQRQLDAAFEAQFGYERLNRTRSLLKLYFRQYSQIEDFHALVPEIFRGEGKAELIVEYLNPMLKDEREAVERKVNECLTSPNYIENQMPVMLLTNPSCSFKELVVECMVKHIVACHLESVPSIGNVPENVMETNKTEDKTRYRLNLLVSAEPDILVKACLSTDTLPTSLLDVIVSGLDIISKEVTQKRALIFEDFRPPLFNGNDPTTSLSGEYLKFFGKFKETPSGMSVLTRVKESLRKMRKNSANTSFWMELFLLLNDQGQTESSTL